MDDAEREIKDFCDDKKFLDGFHALLARYGKYLLVILHRDFSDRGIDLEAVSQESWIKILKSRNSFCQRQGRKFKAYLRTIGKRFALQFLRRKRGDSLPDNMDPIDEGIDQLDSFENGHLDVEHLMTAEGALAGQPPYIPVEDPDLKECMETLKQKNPAGFDALVSKQLGEHAEKRAMEIHGMTDKQELYERRSTARKTVKDCMVAKALNGESNK